jgi:hypothetical protein
MGKSSSNDNDATRCADRDLAIVLDTADQAVLAGDRKRGVEAIEAIWACLDGATESRRNSPEVNRR